MSLTVQSRRGREAGRALEEAKDDGPLDDEESRNMLEHKDRGRASPVPDCGRCCDSGFALNVEDDMVLFDCVIPSLIRWMISSWMC